MREPKTEIETETGRNPGSPDPWVPFRLVLWAAVFCVGLVAYASLYFGTSWGWSALLALGVTVYSAARLLTTLAVARRRGR